MEKIKDIKDLKLNVLSEKKKLLEKIAYEISSDDAYEENIQSLENVFKYESFSLNKMDFKEKSVPTYI